ncbi:hypothetical protein COT72_00810, partial [archaeon CG10_big_fil_rev_8_21_14_0_10_43_11]
MRMSPKHIFISLFTMFSVSPVFAQLEGSGLFGGLSVVGGVVGGLIGVLQESSNILTVARVFSFVILIAVTGAAARSMSASRRGQGLDRAAAVFGVVVAVATQVLAPPVYHLLFMVVAAVLGELILLVVVVVYVRTYFSGGGQRVSSAPMQVLTGFAALGAGSLFFLLTALNFEYLMGVVSQSLGWTAGGAWFITSLAGWLALPNVVVI